MDCELCHKPGGRMRLHEGKMYCHKCLRDLSVENKVRTPAVHGDFESWFAWDIGELVTSRSMERQLERTYATGSASDKGFAKDVLGIDEGMMEEATETTLRRGAEELSHDIKLGQKLGQATAKAASKGKRVFGHSKVQPTADSLADPV